MSPQVSVPRSVHAGALLLGLAAWPLAAFLESTIYYLSGPAPTVIPILIGGALAGLIVGSIVSAEETKNRAEATKLQSTRASFLAALVAAATLVVRATIHHAQPGHIAGLGLMTLFYAVVALLPATMVGMFMGALGGAGHIAFRGHPEFGKPAFTLQPVHAIYAACVLAFLAPFLPGFLSKPAPPVVAKVNSIASTPSQPPSPPTPTSPSFAYSKPGGFDVANATQLEVIASRTIGEVDVTEPMLLSPDARRFACHLRAENSPRLIVYDLDAFTEISRISLGSAAAALAWSPDSSRLVGLFETDDARWIGVLVPQPTRTIPLPRPESFQLSFASLGWPDASEVVLYPRTGAPQALNLDTLELRKLDHTLFHGSLSAPMKEQVGKPPIHAIPRNDRWTFGLGWRLDSAKPRVVNDAPSLNATGKPCLAAIDTRNGSRRHFREMAVAAGSPVLVSSDASKVLIAQDNRVSVHYLGLREVSKVRWKIATRLKLDQVPKAEHLKKALAEKRLCAFVYAPLVNPLNDRVVGASREAVKGIVRFLSWEDTTAEIALQEEFLPIASGDIVAIPHVWENREPKEIMDYNVPEWWAPLGDEGESNMPAIPPGKELPPLDAGRDFKLTAQTHSLTFEEVQPAKPAPPPASALSPPRSANSLDAIARFIEDHHARSSRGDIDGLMENYAPFVEHYQSGLVSRDFVRDAEVKYHAPGYRIVERVVGTSIIRPLTATRMEATYKLSFLRVKPDGSWTSGIADVTLDIEATALGPRIVRQTSTVRESEKRRGDRNPPNL